MSNIKDTLLMAAERLEYLYAGASHIPTDLVAHAQGIRGRVTPRDSQEPVAQAFYGGLAEVIVALGPPALPLLATWVRHEAFAVGDADHERCDTNSCPTVTALRLAEHVLKNEES